MNLNSLIFPAPQCSYTDSTFPNELLWIPSNPSIPALFLQSPSCPKILVYFHGNAEDLGIAYEMLDILRTYLKINILAVEYPGYGLYPGSPSASRIERDSLTVYGFLVQTLRIQPRDIILFGRSIGSGPSTYLGRSKPVASVLLMSPFTSIRDASRDAVGKLASYFVADRFRNIDNIQYFQSPTFILHGLLDDLIPYTHAQELHLRCSGPCHLELSKEMDHNKFDYYDDLLQPLTTFFCNSGIELEQTDKVCSIPDGYFSVPRNQPAAHNAGSIHKLINSIKL